MLNIFLTISTYSTYNIKLTEVVSLNILTYYLYNRRLKHVVIALKKQICIKQFLNMYAAEQKYFNKVIATFFL